MPILHGQPPEQNWSREKYTEQEVLNLVAADLNNDGIPDVLDVRILGWQPVLPPEVEISNDTGNPVPVTVVAGTLGASVLQWNEATSVPASTPTVVVTYTVPTGKTLNLSTAEASGTNCGTFWVTVDGNIIGRKYTYWCDFNCKFDFSLLPVAAGGVVRIWCQHTQSSVGDFNGNIQGNLT